MLRNKILLLLTVTSINSFAQESAQEIFNKATEQLATNNVELSMDVDETDAKGRTKSKSFDISMAKFGQLEKTKIVMQQPERAKGVTIIISSSQGAEGEIEVFTPANGKIRKMKATAENMALVGFDFFMVDFSFIDQKDIYYKFMEKIQLDSRNCVKLEVGSKTNTQADKAQLIIEEESSHIIQINMFDSEGNPISLTELSDYQSIQGSKGKVQPMHIATEDFKKSKKSDIQISRVNYRNNFNESDFTL